MSATAEFADWLERGRAHQREGRPVDAMLCFRRAQKSNRTAADPPFHLGEVLWQLGRLHDALASWREAARMDPRFAAPAQALAEALLSIGDARAARDAATRAHELAPDSARVTMIAGIADLALADAGTAAQAYEAIGRALDREPNLAAAPSLAGPLANVLDVAAATPDRDGFVARLSAMPTTLTAAPPLFLAQALERAASTAIDVDGIGALLNIARTRGYALTDHDALRRIALAAAHFDSANARELAAHYAAICIARKPKGAPLLWPRRTAGSMLRVVALISPDSAPVAAAAAVALLSGLPRNSCDARLVAFDEGSLAGAGDLPTLVLSQPADDASARAVASGDPDIIIDFAGLAAATGPLLATRPGRAIWSIATFALPNADALVDRIFNDADDLAAAIEAALDTMDTRDSCPLDGTQLAAIFEHAVRAHQRGDLAQAIEGYANVLVLQPDYAPALYLSGIARRDGGDLDGARAAFASAMTAAPDYVEPRLAAIQAAMDAHDATFAAALCEEGLARAPAEAGLWRASGLAELALGNGVAAAAAFAQALLFDQSHGETHYNHGVALQLQHNLAEAARAYQRALAFRPDLIAAHFNLGVLFQEQGMTAAAVAAYGEVLAADPANAAAYRNLGEVLLAAARIDPYLANFKRFEKACPDALPLAVQALVAYQYLGDFAKLERYLEDLRHGRFAAHNEAELVDALEELLYLLLYFDVEPSMQDQFARTYDAAARRVYGMPLPRPAERRPGRVRVGYLSGDLRNHVMGKMVWSAVEHHDKARFELFFYSLSDTDDEWTAKFRGLADHFHVVARDTERAAATRVAADDLDILVDLCTHTKGAKPGILALKPARVQITYVASAGTLGLSTIDFKLSDRYADLPASSSPGQEVLLPMEGCVYPYRHIEPARDHPFDRAALGIAKDAIVIGAFVSPLKLSRRCLMVWRDALARIPEAQFALSPVHPALRGTFLRVFAVAGIAGDRLLFLPQGRNDAENQARYALVDFVLDPMPYGGVNGTLEALDMGVPVVTLLGRRHGERSSYSILANLGVTDTVAASGGEYVDIAERLACDPEFMRDVRRRIREGLRHSTLTDLPAHTRALERAYLDALAAKAPAAAGIGTDG